MCIEVLGPILLGGLKILFCSAFYLFNSPTKQSTGTDSSEFFNARILSIYPLSDNKFNILLLPVPPEPKNMNIITNF